LRLKKPGRERSKRRNKNRVPAEKRVPFFIGFLAGGKFFFLFDLFGGVVFAGQLPFDDLAAEQGFQGLGRFGAFVAGKAVEFKFDGTVLSDGDIDFFDVW
jgi:hypothetical protein